MSRHTSSLVIDLLRIRLYVHENAQVEGCVLMQKITIHIAVFCDVFYSHKLCVALNSMGAWSLVCLQYLLSRNILWGARDGVGEIIRRWGGD